MNKHDRQTTSSRLRGTAEQLAAWILVHPMQVETDIRKLLHELQVHQIELEMQNSELQRAHNETEAALSKVTEHNKKLKLSIKVEGELQNKDETAKRVTLADISNEILESLNFITKTTSQLRQEGVDSKLEEQLNNIQFASRKLLNIINSF